MDSLSDLLETMAESGLTRSDMLIALGGGVVGDLGGFAAGVYMRGIDYVQIPTTLLAQVDSSVGGKTAVDLRHGKNLAGVFYQPKIVIADTDLLESLPDREFSSGMAEVIKYGAIRSASLFQKLEKHPGRAAVKEILPEIIYECCDIKRRIVENDEFDTGERMVLNFGHTFGHAVEKIGEYAKYTHGEGVAIGMGFAAEYGEHTGNSVPGLRKRIDALCGAFGLPDRGGLTAPALTPHISLDKKAIGSTLRLVMVRDIGESHVISLPASDFGKVMAQL
jgi:3-dehydroquinate synthase